MNGVTTPLFALLSGFVPSGDVDIAGSLLLVFVLLCFSAFFSGSESALFSLDSITVEKLSDTPSRRARAVRSLLDEPRRLLATLLLGNEIVNVSLSTALASVVFSVAAAWGGSAEDYWWLNILVATPVLVLFGDLAPKALAVRMGIRWASVIAVPLQAISVLLTPVRVVLQGAGRLVLLSLRFLTGGHLDALQDGDDALRDALAEAQFRALVRLGAKEGALDPKEAALIHRVFDLTDTPVSRLMTGRADVKAISLLAAGPDLVAMARDSGFSRLPVYAGDLDHIKGVLLLKDLLRLRARGEPITPRSLERLLQPAFFVPPGKPAGELLRAFQSKRAHIAVVLDEYGTVLGVVTMQDLLEALFEPIRRAEEGGNRDPARDVEKLGEGIYRVPARLPITDFNRLLAPPLPAGATYTTVAGFIFHAFGRLPAKGDQIERAGWTFHVSGMVGTRLTQVTATRVEPPGHTSHRARDMGLPPLPPTTGGAS